MGAFADAARLFRRGLAIVDERGARTPVDAMARALTRPARSLGMSRALAMGTMKYALCTALASAVAAACAFALGSLPAGTLAFLVVFYVVEVQLVFLFPIALDAAAPASPLRWWSHARTLTARVGTWRAFWTVVPIAARMALGVVSTSPLRKWCAGCAAVVVWYEEVAHGGAPPSKETSS